MNQQIRRHSPEMLISLVILAVVVTVYSRSLQAGFVHWDDSIVYDNPHIRGLDWERIRWMFADLKDVWRYMPLTWLGWALTYELFGLNPFAYHLGNLLFHCTNALFVFLLLRKLFLVAARIELTTHKRDYLLWCCGLGALFWAIHPLRVETVAWVTDRVYVQSLFFLLLSLLCYLEYCDPARPNKGKFYWYSVGAFAAALLSYQIGLGYVLVLAILDAWPLRRFDQEGKDRWWNGIARRIWLEKIPFAVVAGLVVVLTLLARFHAGVHNSRPVSLAEFGIVERAMQAFYIWAYYLWKPWFPVNLSPVYTTLMSIEPTAPRFVLSLLVVVALTVLLALKRRRWPLVSTLWLCHLVLLVPVLGLTEHPHYPNDRYSIIVSILWSVLVTSGLFKLWPLPALRRVMAGVVAVIVVLLSMLSFGQVGIWHDSVTLHEYIIAKLGGHPYCIGLYAQLGRIYSERGDDEKAASCFNQVLQLNPSVPEAHRFLGRILQQQGKLEEAIGHYRAALSIVPNDSYSLNNLGAALAAQGKFDEAVTQLSDAVRVNPGSVSARRNLARALTKLGRLDEARVHEQEAERLDAKQPHSLP